LREAGGTQTRGEVWFSLKLNRKPPSRTRLPGRRKTKGIFPHRSALLRPQPRRRSRHRERLSPNTNTAFVTREPSRLPVHHFPAGLCESEISLFFAFLIVRATGFCYPVRIDTVYLTNLVTVFFPIPPHPSRISFYTNLLVAVSQIARSAIPRGKSRSRPKPWRSESPLYSLRTIWNLQSFISRLSIRSGLPCLP